MKQITDKEYEKYQEYLRAVNNGQLLTPSGVRFLCSTYHYDPAVIGQHFLELLSTVCADSSDRCENPEEAALVNKNWLHAETDAELTKLLDMFSGFHDFRIEQVDYCSAADRIDLYLEDDTHEYRVLLRFIGNVSMNFLPVGDYAADWLYDSSLGINERGQIVWAGDYNIPANELPNDVLWIAGNLLHYALLDEYGLPRQFSKDLVNRERFDASPKIGERQSPDTAFHPKFRFK